MADHMTSTKQKQHALHWRQIGPPVLMIALGLGVGILVFLLLWQGTHTHVATIALRIPKLVWLILLLVILLLALMGIGALVYLYLRDEQSDDHDLHPLAPIPEIPPRREHVFNELPEETPINGAHPTPTSPPLPLRPIVVAPVTPIPEVWPAQAHLHLTPVETPPTAQVLPSPASEQTHSILITLLKEVTISIQLSGGRGIRQVPLNPGTKRAQLLAYLAVRRGELVHRSKILYHVFAWRREDNADEETMGGHFHSHTKLLRNNIKETLLKINEEAGEQLVDPTIDPFITNNEHWGLSPLCRVLDIEEIERSWSIIEQARKEGQLVDLPESVRDACAYILATYRGDFIEDLIKKSPKDFKPWDGKASWAKHYTTHFRSIYLTALWLMGQYEDQRAQQCLFLAESIQAEGFEQRAINDQLQQVLDKDNLAQIAGQEKGEARKHQVLSLLQRERRRCYGRAIEPYKTYALTACRTSYYSGAPFDEKVSYNAMTEQFGDRIAASEQALRRCLKACAFLGNTREANEIYSAYQAQMTALFKSWGLTWHPSQDTQKEWESTRAFTDSHRFSAQAG